MMNFARILAAQGAKGLARVAPKQLGQVITQPPLNQTVGKLLTQPARSGQQAAVARNLAGAMTRPNLGLGTGLKKGSSEAFTRSNAVNQQRLPFIAASPKMTTPQRAAMSRRIRGGTMRQNLQAGLGKGDATEAYGKDPMGEFGMSKPFMDITAKTPIEARGPAAPNMRGLARSVPDKSFPSDPTVGARPYPAPAPQQPPVPMMNAESLSQRTGRPMTGAQNQTNLVIQEAIRRRLAAQRTNPAAQMQLQNQRANRI